MKSFALLLMAVLMLISCLHAERVHAQAVNMVPPTTQAGGWTLQQLGSAKAYLDNDGQTTGLQVTVAQVDNVLWDAELMSPNFILSDGLTYTVIFVARASQPLKIEYNCTVAAGDYHAVGLDNSVNLTTQWQRYRATFQVTRSNGFYSRLNFMLGLNPGSYWISSVQLFQGAPIGLSEDTADPKNWTLELNGSSLAAMARDGDALKVTTTAVDGTDWHVQLYQSGIDLVEGQSYILSFDVKADRLVDVGLNATTALTYQNAGLAVTIHPTPSWQHISYTFRAHNLKGELSRVPDLDIGSQIGTVWVKNASLVPTD